MQEELISFPTAKLAREKGFDLKVKNWFDTSWNPFIEKNPIEWESSIFVDFNSGKIDRFSRPTQTLLQRWLREVRNTHVYVTPESISKQNGSYLYHILGDNITLHFKGVLGMNYEEALEVGLQEGLKMI